MSYQTVQIVLIDYQKAFDHINLAIILQKLVSFGVPDFLILWVQSFLAGSQQRIKIKQTVSSWVTINGGVPQGTKHGPLLFVVQIDDFNPSTKIL